MNWSSRLGHRSICGPRSKGGQASAKAMAFWEDRLRYLYLPQPRLSDIDTIVETARRARMRDVRGKATSAKAHPARRMRRVVVNADLDPPRASVRFPCESRPKWTLRCPPSALMRQIR
jgi:hypothetical protein